MLDCEIAAHVRRLRDKDPNAAYASLLALEAESADSDGVYPWFDDFAALLREKSGFLRVRGVRLLAANARWAEEGRLRAVLPDLLGRITDPKPLVCRQTMAALPRLLEGRPDLAEAVLAALAAADFTGYAGSMRPLLEQDRKLLMDSRKLN